MKIDESKIFKKIDDLKKQYNLKDKNKNKQDYEK